MNIYIHGLPLPESAACKPAQFYLIQGRVAFWIVASDTQLIEKAKLFLDAAPKLSSSQKISPWDPTVFLCSFPELRQWQLLTLHPQKVRSSFQKAYSDNQRTLYRQLAAGRKEWPPRVKLLVENQMIWSQFHWPSFRKWPAKFRNTLDAFKRLEWFGRDSETGRVSNCEWRNVLEKGRNSSGYPIQNSPSGSYRASKGGD